jgi:hypothetical protein
VVFRLTRVISGWPFLAKEQKSSVHTEVYGPPLAGFAVSGDCFASLLTGDAANRAANS